MKESIEVHLIRSKIFLLYFYDAYDVNLRKIRAKYRLFIESKCLYVILLQNFYFRIFITYMILARSSYYLLCFSQESFHGRVLQVPMGVGGGGFQMGGGLHFQLRSTPHWGALDLIWGGGGGFKKIVEWGRCQTTLHTMTPIAAQLALCTQPRYQDHCHLPVKHRQNTVINIK